MTTLNERDAMVCRACGKEERASEGYPCQECGTFICMICNFRGVVLCAKCQVKLGVSAEGARFSTATPVIGMEAIASPGEMPAAEEKPAFTSSSITPVMTPPVEAPKAEPPKVDEPVAEAPKIEEPGGEAPKVEEPKSDAEPPAAGDTPA